MFYYEGGDNTYSDGVIDARAVVESDDVIDLIIARVESATGHYDPNLAKKLTEEISKEIATCLG